MTIAPTRQRTSVEVPPTLADPAPRPLGAGDQAGQWANLGVSLLGFGGALAIAAPAGFTHLSLAAALTAAVVGTLLGTVVLAASAVPGARTGAPAMVLLRGVFGARLSAVPTVLNITQCLGWSTFEMVVIADGARTVTHQTGPRWAYVVGAGVLTTLLALRPLGVIRVLRRYVTAVMVLAVAYLAVQLLPRAQPVHLATSWTGFWSGTDAAVAVAVSWVPLVSDYSRHSRRPRDAFWGTFLGYGTTQIVCFGLGLVTLGLVADDPTRIFSTFLAVPLGAVAFAVLVVREVDQTFTTVYSTAVSAQNLRPLADRRVLAVAVGALSTGLALTLDIGRYASFLYLIGSVFVPLAAVLLIDYVISRGATRWDLTTTSPARPLLLLPWALGFGVYQLINPGGIGWWATGWVHFAHAVGFTAQPWMSASIASFLIAGAVTAAVDLSSRTHRRT